MVFLKLVQVHTDPDMQLTDEERAHIAEIELRVPRGEICDRAGNMLASDRRVFSLWANPRQVADPEMTAMALSARLGLDETELRNRLTRRNDNDALQKFVWIKRWLTESNLQAYTSMDPSLQWGLALKQESIRYYPEGELAAHVVGFVNKEGVGCDGVELSFDKYLRCVSGKQKSHVDAKRNFLRSLTVEYTQPEGGDTVYLTLDKAIQRTLEVEIDKALVSSHAPRGMGLIVDVKTGGILAMTVRPAFDPNAIGDINAGNYRNRALEFVFEPGSSFKIVAASGALEEGLITPETRINCENGFYNPYGHGIKDFHRLGVEPFVKCFEESSNIAIIKVGALLGPERLEHWISRFGIGRRTCSDFSLESAGIFRPRAKWSRLSMGSLPMGQEVAVTMLQLARAFCVIANGGYLRDFHVVERAIGPDGVPTYEYEPREPERILSEATVKTMQELCHLVILNGTGKPACIPEYRAGGKTGTAQIANPLGKGFLPGKFTAIFAGFAPIADPRVCAVIVVQEPAIKLHFGGSVCGPVFKEVVRDALIRMECPPDPVGGMPANPDPALEEEDEDTLIARNEAADGVVVPDEAITPPNGLLLAEANVEAAQNEPALPSFVGMTKRQVKESIDALGIAWDPQGAGRVVSQDPPPGTALRDVPLCRLVFSSEPMGKQNETQPAPGPARM